MDAWHAWETVFLALTIQATPYLVLGVLVSTALELFVPHRALARVLPRRAFAAVPVAAVAGAALPGCECSSVPVAATLAGRGVPAGAAAAFMLSAPAVNPVVLVATSVAFPTRPEMVLARALASFATAVVVGWLWHRAEPAGAVPTEAHEHGGRSRWHQARVRAMRTLDRSIAMLALGAAASATMNVAVPQTWLRSAGTHLVTGVLTLALLAVVLAVCSEADAFVASSFAQFSSTAQLAFMVVGPAVDVKLAAMYAGTFGRRFVIRFVPLVLAVAVTVTAIVSWIVL